MSKRNVAQELIKKFSKEEILSLIKKLERKKTPIQIYVLVRIDAPSSSRLSHKYCEDIAEEYFGKFSDRLLEVKRVNNLDPKYEHDVKLLERSYKNLGELVKTIENYDVLYSVGYKNNTAERAHHLVKKETGKNDLVTPLGDNDHWEGKEFMERVYKILEEKGITYLRHKIRARVDGVYEDRTGGATLVIVNETKVADISLKLL